MRGNCYDVTCAIRTTDAGAGSSAFADAVRLYEGGDPAYLPCETEYHDIQRVLDVTLAMARLMDGYQA